MKRTIHGILVLFVLIASSGCSRLLWEYTKKPELIQNQPSEISEGDAVFKQRIKKELSGMNVSELQDELQRQGFDVDRTNQKATFLIATLPCNANWVIQWKSKGNTVTDLDGGYFMACL